MISLIFPTAIIPQIRQDTRPTCSEVAKQQNLAAGRYNDHENSGFEPNIGEGGIQSAFSLQPI
jgi:hypothetical protein